MAPPVPFFDMGKFLKYFRRCTTFHPPHDFRRGDRRRRRNKNMNMVPAHNTTQYLNLEIFAGLPYKVPYSLGKWTLQNMIAIFCHPNKMIFYLVLGMAACSVFHARHYKATASLKLPA